MIALVKGSDPILLNEAALELMTSAVGGADRGEVLDELSGDEYAASDIVLAASSVSMFGERVVVARNASRFTVDELAPLIAYLADPNPTSSVVIVWDKPVTGRFNARPVPKKLLDAVKAAGGSVVDASAPANAKARAPWLDARLSSAGVSFNAAAKKLVVERFGEEINRLPALLTLLESSFPVGAKLSAEDIEPFLGAEGGVPPWDLTDAIDRGDVLGSVHLVRRMTDGGQRHPLQVMATLSTHVERWCRLDGAGVRTEDAAVAVLGIKGFPAKKAMTQAAKLGSARIRRAVQLVAQADVDLRGMTAVPGEATLEVLVARLAQLSR